LASLAGRFDSEISLGRGDEWVSGASVLSILCLAATQGTALRVRAVGVDAEQAVLELGVLIESPEDDISGKRD
jgi:phosphocarrier protein